MKLSERMKEYEKVSNIKLTRRTPVIIRLDGRAFHTFTKGMNKPFDKMFIKVMQETALNLCENISNVKLALVQSDEISILMTDWDNLETMPFFDNKIQKLTSITSSMATAFFINKWFELTGNLVNVNFDSRVFNIPEKEVVNYFIWRQQDWTRNSIQMVAQSKFSQKQIDNKSNNELQEMLFQGFKINWNDYPVVLKRGTTIIKQEKEVGTMTDEGIVMTTKFRIDKECPIFTKDRDYVEKQFNIISEEK